MTSHLKSYPDGLRQLFVRASAEEVDTAFHSAAQAIQKNYQIPGFRKGKVPLDMIEKQNPAELLPYAENILTNQALDSLKDVQMFGSPRFNPISGLSRGKEFAFAVVFEAYPVLAKAPDFSKTAFTYEECILEDSFVAELACKQAGLMDQASGAAQDGDMVHVRILNKDYTGPKPEAAFDTGKLPLLVGKKTGDSLSLKLDELSGYLPEFIGRVSEPVQCEITEILRAKKWENVKDEDIVGKTPFKTKDEYLSATKMQLSRMVDQVNDSRKTDALTQAVGSQLEIEIPKSLWLNNVRDLSLKLAENEVIRGERSLDSLSQDKGLSEKFARLPIEAKEGIAFIFWLDEIARQEKFTVEGPELDYYLYRYAQQENISMADFQKRLNAQDKQKIEQEAVREKTIAFLLKNYTFTASATVPFSEVWKRR